MNFCLLNICNNMYFVYLLIISIYMKYEFRPNDLLLYQFCPAKKKQIKNPSQTLKFS